MKKQSGVWILTHEEQCEGATIIAVFGARPPQRKVCQTLKPHCVRYNADTIGAAVWKHGECTIGGVDQFKLVRWRVQ